MGTTRIKLPDNGNSRKAIFRDIIMAFIPFYVMYKISTHPMIAKIGYQDPNEPKKPSQREIIEQSLYTLSLKKRQVELQKEHLFFEAMDAKKCYDAPTIDIYAKLIPKKGRRPPFKRRGGASKEKNRAQRQSIFGKRKGGKSEFDLFCRLLSRSFPALKSRERKMKSAVRIKNNKSHI